jgi:predicted DNA-binding protein (MmcQ/YjbR family)
MNVEDIQAYAASKPGAEETFPFGNNTLVYKVNGKAFLLMALDTDPLRCNVKVDPDEAIEQREAYPDHIFPGFHMNKKHWNTILPQGLKTSLVKELIDASYRLVAKIKNK